MPEEEDIFDLYHSGIKLLDEMRSRSMEPKQWSYMIRKAFEKEDVGALKKVIGLLRENLAAHPGSPADQV
jgi:hypothetical protein